jgi:hypothetical protein
MKAKEAQMARAQQRQGAAGQDLAQTALREIGVEFVHKIGTPIKMIPSGRKDGTYRIIFGEKVAGDTRGILPGGRSVLAEIKTIYSDRLVYSDLRPHQPGQLSLHSEWGGVSLLVWVHESGVYIMQWPIKGFKKGIGIDVEWAESIRVENINQLR